MSAIPSAENTRASDAEPAELLYNAYGNDANWQTWDGRPMPDWPDLSPAVKRHWRAAAKEAERQRLEYLRTRPLEQIREEVNAYADQLRRAQPGPYST